MNAASLAERALATHRLTRLLVTDEITRPARDRVIGHVYRSLGLEARGPELAARHRLQPTTAAATAVLPDEPTAADWWEQPTDAIPWSKVVGKDPHPPRLAYLATCPWCAGVYVAAAVTILERRGPRWWPPVRSALAIAGAAGILAGWETP